MAARVNGHDDVVAEINVTPFIDVVLVLLVVLMVTSTAIVRAALKVDLPRAASAGQAVTSTVNVVITREGELFLDGAAITREGLAERVRGERARAAELVAVIAADRGVAYGRVVEVLDTVKQSGVTSFALNLQRAPADGAP